MLRGKKPFAGNGNEISRRSIRSAWLSIGWHARAVADFSFSPSPYPSVVTYWRLRFIQLLIRHKVRWHFGPGLKHVFSLSLISGPNTRHPAPIPGMSAASRLYDDENNGLFSSPSSTGTKTLEKKQSRRARKRGRREKERRGIDPRRKVRAGTERWFFPHQAMLREFHW